MKRGLFISFEGSEGCGKSTQIEEMKRRFERDGAAEVIVTREPGGTAVGEEVRRLLQFTPEAANMVPEAELLLFAASRAQLVRELIRPSLAEGKIVIADRFMDSTTVYQGMARGLGVEAVGRINAFAVDECVPDFTVLLDMDSALAHERVHGGRGERRERPDGRSAGRVLRGRAPGISRACGEGRGAFFRGGRDRKH
jgi:dTMP kinase